MTKEFEDKTLKVTTGTTQLDDFVDENITEDGPPELLFIENTEDLNFVDDYDEEERIAKADVILKNDKTTKDLIFQTEQALEKLINSRTAQSERK